MSLYKLLSLGDKKVMNIGDYIQALASAQFFPHIDGFIDREKLKDYDGVNCNVIMNGWFMHDPTQWPPSVKINPLFVALHINTSVTDKLLSEEGVAYLKKFEPIGCRDTFTRDNLISKGISAYFSGCMTLTLGESYRSEIRDNTCYFVDPVVETPKSILTILKNGVSLALHYRGIKNISNKYYNDTVTFPRLLKMAGFYRIYTRYFTPQTLIEATYINQESSRYAQAFSTDEERLEEAKRLVGLYSRAKLVVTSRIHCALPCLGLETPVVYTAKMNDSEKSACRFGGLMDLFNVLTCDSEKSSINFTIEKKIDKDNPVTNKNTWKELAHNLIKTCREFVKQSEDNTPS